MSDHELLGQREIVQKLVADAFPRGIQRDARSNMGAFPSMGAEMVEDIFQRRSSVRFFNRDDGVDFNDLKILLSDVALFEESIWGGGDPRLQLRAYVFPERISAGHMDSRCVYEFVADSATFASVGRLRSGMTKESMVLQKEFVDAAAILIWVAGLADAVDDYGSCAYKELLIRSGALAHFAWLKSLSLGYEGTVFAGILPKVLRQVCGIDGYRKNQMFAFALGKRA